MSANPVEAEDVQAEPAQTALVPTTENPEAALRADGKPRGRPFTKGNCANPGGRPKALRLIEQMLNKEHRNVEGLREVFARLRALAMGEVIMVPCVSPDGTEIVIKAELKADARFMQLYLDRLLGPAKAFDDAMDLSDAPTEVIEYLRIKVSR